MQLEPTNCELRSKRRLSGALRPWNPNRNAAATGHHGQDSAPEPCTAPELVATAVAGTAHRLYRPPPSAEWHLALFRRSLALRILHRGVPRTVSPGHTAWGRHRHTAKPTCQVHDDRALSCAVQSVHRAVGGGGPAIWALLRRHPQRPAWGWRPRSGPACRAWSPSCFPCPCHPSCGASSPCRHALRTSCASWTAPKRS